MHMNRKHIPDLPLFPDKSANSNSSAPTRGPLKRWTQEELDWLDVMKHDGLSNREIGRRLGRSMDSVRRKAPFVGAPRPPREDFWSEDDKQALRDLWAADEQTSAIAAKLDRTEIAVTQMARKMGLSRRSFVRRPDTWSHERDAILTREWRNGTRTEIIARMVDRSRNAVIGRAHRLDLGRHPLSPEKPPAWTPYEMKTLQRGRRDGKSYEEIAMTLPGRTLHACVQMIHKSPPDLPGVPLEDTRPNGCRFAISPHDAKSHEHRFCNEPVIDGASWCPEHAKRVGMTQADMERLKAKQDKVKAHAEARRNRMVIDFASRVAARRDNGVEAA